MYTEVMDFFGLKQPLICASYYDTEQRKKLYKELKFLIQAGGIYALTGMVGAGKTTLLNQIQQEMELENKISVSRSLSTEKHKLHEKIKVSEVITPEASLRLAQALITPLQIHKYLTTAMEIAYTTGTKPITEEVINKALAPDLNSLEAQLARIGYQLPAVCELLHASPKEVKDFLHGWASSVPVSRI